MCAPSASVISVSSRIASTASCSVPGRLWMPLAARSSGVMAKMFSVISAGGVSFLYHGETGALLQALSAMPIRDLSIAEPDIEETFMHFYQKEGDDK